MATLTVRELPDELHRRLKARAKAHGRSLNSEIIACLEANAGAEELDPETLLAWGAFLRSQVGGDSRIPTLLLFGRTAGHSVDERTVRSLSKPVALPVRKQANAT